MAPCLVVMGAIMVELGLGLKTGCGDTVFIISINLVLMTSTRRALTMSLQVSKVVQQ